MPVALGRTVAGPCVRVRVAVGERHHGALGGKRGLQAKIDSVEEVKLLRQYLAMTLPK